MTLLKSKEDFEQYKKITNEYHTVVEGAPNPPGHLGEPERYPCLVSRNWLPYEYHYRFRYQHEVVCSECGHKSYVWPEQYS